MASRVSDYEKAGYPVIGKAGYPIIEKVWYPVFEKAGYDIRFSKRPDIQSKIQRRNYI